MLILILRSVGQRIKTRHAPSVAKEHVWYHLLRHTKWILVKLTPTTFLESTLYLQVDVLRVIYSSWLSRKLQDIFTSLNKGPKHRKCWMIEIPVAQSVWIIVLLTFSLLSWVYPEKSTLTPRSSAERVTLRKVATCAPLHLSPYATLVNQTLGDGATDEFLLVDIGKMSEAGNWTFEYDTHSSWINIGYDLQ